MSTRKALSKDIADYIPYVARVDSKLSHGILSAIAMASTFTDCSFRCKSSTSDSAPFLTALLHLHSATLDFRQIWLKRSVRREAVRLAKRHKKPEKREMVETRTKRFKSGPQGVDRRAFLMRSAMIGAMSVITGVSISCEEKTEKAARTTAETGTAPTPPLSPDLDVVTREKGPSPDPHR
jgi:uncharacterized protein (DUF305 family)